MRYIICIYLVFFTIYASAQVPQRMSYQAVIRNANNTLLSQQLIGVRISILQADTAGQPVYVETHYTKTNINALMTLQIGGGLKFFGDFNSINWSTGRYFVKTETDPDGGFDYRITGYSELLSVPYALYAGGQTDTTNLIKRINTKLSITDTTSMLAPYAKKEKLITKADLDSTNNFDINLKGNISSSKNVTVKGNIEALGSTSTLGTIDKPFKGLFLSAGSLSIASDTLGKNIPAAILSNVEGNLQISAGGVKLMGDNTSFIAPRIVGALTGNATSATKLQTARTINNIPFDGSANITIATTSPNSITYTNTGTGDVPGGAYDGSLAKTISYNSIGASPLAGSSFITTVGTLSSGSIPFTLLSGTIPTWNQSTSGNAATATYATSAGSLSGTIPIWNQSTTGNAATATKLAATKNINGVAFDGSADISITTIADAGTLSGTTLNGTILNSSLTSVGTLANLTVTNPITGSVTGNAATANYATSAGSLSGTIPTWNQSTTGNAATATYATSAGTASKATILETARNINGVSFDGSADITISTTAPNSLTYNNSGIGDVSGGTYDGSLAKTISYNSVGASPLAGSASITTLGTIATGTWSATNIGIAHGGTNTNATPTSGAIIYGNGTSYAISAAGTSGQYLQSAGTGAPIWAQPGPASIQVLSSSGTYTTPAGVKVIIIELVGGGGGSGGINAPSNNQSTVSGGGGSGAYTRAIILNPNATYTFTIGIGGIASAAGSAGVAGGQTSFDGTNITAPGGLGGGAGSTTGTGTVSQGGLGGALGVGGAIMITGNSGGSGFSISSIAVSGAGANSYFGEGGVSRATASAVLAGAPGIGYGGGASGAAASTTTLAAGAAGFHGVIIVTEYK
ncbi:MAG: hypothetical protein LW604_01425 [Sediminibacterium sp.]|nr:hypothetical protein [Sediminibacterium sp.]